MYTIVKRSLQWSCILSGPQYLNNLFFSFNQIYASCHLADNFLHEHNSLASVWYIGALSSQYYISFPFSGVIVMHINIKPKKHSWKGILTYISSNFR